jgi:CHAT domain-containing protein
VPPVEPESGSALNLNVHLHCLVLDGVYAQAVVRVGSDDLGAVEGEVYLDAEFTAEALAGSLEASVPWVHIASHFQYTAGGTEADSYLILGDETALSVKDLREGEYPLAEVDLLVLSACQTAMTASPMADGSEVEGLAVMAQNQDAGAVMATLWSVADASTAAWMASFYEGQAGSPTSRATAVRRVQLAFVTGEVSADRLPASVRGSAPLVSAPSRDISGLEGWKHPYYWAPFVLYGTGG